MPGAGQGCKNGHHWMQRKRKLRSGKWLWKCKFCPYSKEI